ncbi:unnamed protein product [Peniophora sp. CBMAI 1063]|nr:unnamed protein product [Peniophora sp. CBMAI 1063]
MISIKFVEEPKKTYPVAHITFGDRAGGQRIRVPPGFRLFLNEDALINVIQLEGASTALPDAQVHNANCYWCMPTRESEAEVKEAWKDYKKAEIGSLWPVLWQPTSLDRDSLKDVINTSSVGHFLLNKALDGEDKHSRVLHELARFSSHSLISAVEASGERRADIEFGVTLVVAALKANDVILTSECLPFHYEITY